MGGKAQLETLDIMTDWKRKALSLHVGQAVAVGSSNTFSCFPSRYYRFILMASRIDLQVADYRTWVYSSI